MIFVTVPHSGTMQTMELLLKGGPWQIGHHGEKPAGHFWFSHLEDVHMPRILELAEEMPVVTTERPYADIEASWIRRGESLDDLAMHWRNYQRILELNPYIIRLGRL